jgi:hypothetical protein
MRKAVKLFGENRRPDVRSSRSWKLPAGPAGSCISAPGDGGTSLQVPEVAIEAAEHDAIVKKLLAEESIGWIMLVRRITARARW